MIRPIEKKDTVRAVELVHALNLTSEFYSGYCPRDKTLIEEEIEEAMKAKTGLLYEDKGNLEGVLLYFKTPTGTCDLSGPFVKKGSITIGNALMKSFLEMTGKTMQVNAFFDASSDFYKTLMSMHGFKFQENEFILKLFKDSVTPYERSMVLKQPTESDKPLLKTMHREIFGDVYISEDMLVNKDRFKHVLMPEDQGQILGFALLIPRKNSAYLEIFGLREAYRGKGYAKPFLNALAERAFRVMKKDHVMLVVDAINERALKVYTDTGFEIVQKNVSYKRSN